MKNFPGKHQRDYYFSISSGKIDEEMLERKMNQEQVHTDLVLFLC